MYDGMSEKEANFEHAKSMAKIRKAKGLVKDIMLKSLYINNIMDSDLLLPYAHKHGLLWDFMEAKRKGYDSSFLSSVLSIVPQSSDLYRWINKVNEYNYEIEMSMRQLSPKELDYFYKKYDESNFFFLSDEAKEQILFHSDERKAFRNKEILKRAYWIK